MAREIIGYKLTKPEYREAAIKISGYAAASISFEEWMSTSGPNTGFPSNLRNAGVLDLWFEPIYEEDKLKAGDWVVLSNGAHGWGAGREVNNQTVKIDKIDFKERPAEGGRVYFTFDGIKCTTVYQEVKRLATEDEIRQAPKDALVREAKKRYPIGTKFYPAHTDEDGKNNNDICIVTNADFGVNSDTVWAKTDDGRQYDSSPKYGNTSFNRNVYHQGRWARIASAFPKVEINGYTAKFSDDEVSFGCQTYKKDFIITLWECLDKNNISMDFKEEIRILAKHFNS